MMVAPALVVLARGVAAQTIETPVPFDSAGRVVAVTPALAARLRLASPAWPVTSQSYREARLYSVDPGGGFVLVIQRATGALERFPLTSAQRALLGDAVNSATAANGRPSTETSADLVSEPAGGAFVRHQTFLGATVYGGLAASLTTDPTAAGAVYLATAGASFFAAYSAARSMPFTRAQSDLAGNLALAGGGIGVLAGYAVTGHAETGVRALSLAGAISGTVAGISLGEKLTDAEADAAMFGMETAAAASLVVTGAASGSSRTMAGAVAAVSVIGYPIGVKYPRRASYQVTAGDVEATSTAALVGALAGASVSGLIQNPTTSQTTAFLAGGYLVGAFAGDRLLARPLDFRQSDATLLNVAAVAGALVGLVVPVLARSENKSLNTGMPALGAVLGMSVVASALPGVHEHRQANLHGPDRLGSHLSFAPSSLIAIAARSPGAYSLA
ncbi:MAG: hypothetical protein ABI442_12865, partial [Gemmatimonadaceae bacterium]